MTVPRVPGGSADASRARLAGRVLPAAAVVLAVFAYLSSGVDRLVLAVVAVSMALLGGLVATRGSRVQGPIRWATALFGCVVMVGGLALMIGGVWLMTLGSFALLAGLVAVPAGIAPLAWGFMLVQTALAAPASEPLDLDAARRSEAVRRFDAMHGPRAGGAPPPAPRPAPPAAEGE